MIDYVWNTQKSLRRQPGFSLCQFLRTEHWRMTSLCGKDGVKGSAITATSAGWHHSECLNFPSRTLILVRYFSNSLSSFTPALPFLSSLASSMSAQTLPFHAASCHLPSDLCGHLGLAKHLMQNRKLNELFTYLFMTPCISLCGFYLHHCEGQPVQCILKRSQMRNKHKKALLS